MYQFHIISNNPYKFTFKSYCMHTKPISVQLGIQECNEAEIIKAAKH